MYDKIIHSGLKDVIVLKKEDIAGHIESIAKPGDMILVLGAGDIKKIADELTQSWVRGFKRAYEEEVLCLTK